MGIIRSITTVGMPQPIHHFEGKET